MRMESAQELLIERDELRKELREAKSAFSYIATHMGGPIGTPEAVVSYARSYEARIADVLDPKDEHGR